MEIVTLNVFQDEELSISSETQSHEKTATVITIKGYNLLERLTEIVENLRQNRDNYKSFHQEDYHLYEFLREECLRQSISPGRPPPPRVSLRRMPPILCEIVEVKADFPEDNENRSTMNDFDDEILDYIDSHVDVNDVQIVGDETLRLSLKNKSDADIVISLLNNKCINDVNLKAYQPTIL